MIENPDVNIITFRDAVEAKLMQQFSGHLRKLDEETIEAIDKFNDKWSGHLGLVFLVNGQNRLSASTHYPDGLLYEDSDGMFGVAVCFRSEKWEPCIHIISPRGDNWQRAIDNFTHKVWEHLPEAQIFVRYTFLIRCDKLTPKYKVKPAETEECEVAIVLKESL